MKCETMLNAPTASRLSAKVFVGWAFASLVVLSSSYGWCQESPFGGPGVPAKPPIAADDVGPEGKVSPLEALLADEKDPLVRSIVESAPATPEQWIHDAQILLNLNRKAFAKEYLSQFLAVIPDADALTQIQARYGSGFFLRLSNTAELQPEGATVANAVMEAAAAQIQNSARLAALVDRLNNADPPTRRSAVIELVKAGTVAAIPMIAVLGDAQRADEHAAIGAALVALGSEAVDPLVATLNSKNSAQRIQAMALLGRIKAMKAVPFVLRTALAPDQDPKAQEAARQMLQAVLSGVPSREEAIRHLERRRDEFLAGALPQNVDQNDQLTVWIWDLTQQLPVQQTLTGADASFLAAAFVSEELHALDGENVESDQLYLATNLEVAKRLNGYNRPLTEQLGPIYQYATAASSERLEEVLKLALDKNMQGAAIAAIELLGATKRVELLKSEDGQPRPLAEALTNPLPRVKFAAARAVMEMDPQESYPGCSYLPAVLGYFSASGGERRVLIGHPRIDMAQQLAGYFDVLGFAADSRATGRGLVLQASKNPDYCFILIHDAIERPRYRELVQMIRRDRRTADLPIGLLVRDVNKDPADWFARTDPLTLALAPPQTQEDVAVDTRRLLAIAGRGQVSADERMGHAVYALSALTQLAADPKKYHCYDLMPLDDNMERALAVPELAAQAAGILGQLGTPEAQRALVLFAGMQVHPIADRRAAATAFRKSVALRGLLLTREQRRTQYDRYNSSEFLDADTQQVLASILDTIESRTRGSSPAKSDD